MTTPGEVKELFIDASELFTPITGSPTENNIKRIHEVLTNLLQSIDIPSGANKLSHLIDKEAN